MKRLKATVLAVAAALALTVFPMASPAGATHSCGFEPCPHVDDVVTFLCDTFPVLQKFQFCL